MLYKRGGFTPEEIAKLRAHTKAMSFDEIYYPGIKVDTAELTQILQDYRDQFFFEGDAGRSDGPSEKEPSDKPPPGMTTTGTTKAEAKDEVAAEGPRVPATVLGRLAWHHLINGGWQTGRRRLRLRHPPAHQPPAVLRRLRQG